MKLGILSFRQPSARAAEEEFLLKRAALSRGIKAEIFRSKFFQMIYDQKSPWLLYKGKKFPHCDVVITRPSVLRTAMLEVSLVEQMELMGILHFNKYQAILSAKNKVKTMQILDYNGISIPKTVCVSRPDDLAQSVDLVGGFPVIVKEPFGSFGEGVTIVESMRALKSFLRWNAPMYLLQEFVKHSKGKDVRVFVVNGKVIASMERVAQKGEFRSNMELGGIGRSVEITSEEADLALRSVQVLNLHYGGVDIIRGKNGPMVLEVNSNPGFKGLQSVTGVDVAGALVDFSIDFYQRHKQKAGN